MKTNWMMEFSEFFSRNAGQIGVVLYAEGCREGWLQGEMFRQSVDENFQVNSYRLKNMNGTVDLYGERTSFSNTIQKMVAEIKIISASFLTKNIDGNSDIESYARDVPFLVGAEQYEKVNLKEGSLIKDVLRLKSIEEDVEKYMVLVVPRYEGYSENPSLRKALENIKISDVFMRLDFEEHHFSVKVWKV